MTAAVTQSRSCGGADMNQRRSFDLGVLAGILLMLGADAIRWFIVSWHTDAGAARTTLVALQLVVCLGGAAWLILRRLRYCRSSE